MRALCGAIITAGALVGLGLASIGVGARYQGLPHHLTDGTAVYVRFRDLDTAIMISMVALILTLMIGQAKAFLGLAYHHERRRLEHEHRVRSFTGGTSVEP